MTAAKERHHIRNAPCSNVYQLYEHSYNSGSYTEPLFYPRLIFVFSLGLVC